MKLFIITTLSVLESYLQVHNRKPVMEPSAISFYTGTFWSFTLGCSFSLSWHSTIQAWGQTDRFLTRGGREVCFRRRVLRLHHSLIHWKFNGATRRTQSFYPPSPTKPGWWADKTWKRFPTTVGFRRTKNPSCVYNNFESFTVNSSHIYGCRFV